MTVLQNIFMIDWKKIIPGNSYTVDAKQTLSVEFINFAQTKINLYLECKDVASIQKISSQIDENEKSDEINVSLDRMERVAREEFYEVGQMLEKAIGLLHRMIRILQGHYRQNVFL